MSRIRISAVLVTALALTFATSAMGAEHSVEGDNARGNQARAVADQVLNYLSTRSSSSDTQWYSNGVWHFSNDGPYWFCAVGPATLAATLWRVDGESEPALFDKAVATFDATIAARQNSNGSFGEQNLPNTQFFGNELGTTYLLLGNRLDAKHRAAWSSAITRAADYLIHHGDVTWEANGNIDLGNTELEWLAWTITGEARFHAAYELSWHYTIDPPQSRWPGYGLHLTHNGTAGYLGENGGAGPGFDPEYTMLQLSVASRMYLLSHDPRFLWLTNLLWNQLSPLITRPSWTLNAQGGTRRSDIDPLSSPGVVVLATDGGRGALLHSIDPETANAMYPAYLGNARQNWGSPGLYRGYGNELGVALLALASPPAEGRRLSAETSANAPIVHSARRVSATLTSSGVRVAWRPIKNPSRGDVEVSLLVDGSPVKSLRSSRAVLHLAPGLHQISIVAVGLAPGASTAITIPAR